MLVAYNGFTAMAEVKIPGGRVRPEQIKFRGEWKGAYVMVTSPEDAASQLALEYEFALGHPL